MALRSPTQLIELRGLDEVDEALSQGISLEYALYAGPSRVDAIRFPKTGFIQGNIRDLAAFAEYAAVPEDAVQMAIIILRKAFTTLRISCSKHLNSAKTLRQP